MCVFDLEVLTRCNFVEKHGFVEQSQKELERI